MGDDLWGTTNVKTDGALGRLVFKSITHQDVLASKDKGQDLLLEVGQGALGSELIEKGTTLDKHSSCAILHLEALLTSKLSPSGGGMSKERLQMCTCSSPY